MCLDLIFRVVGNSQSTLSDLCFRKITGGRVENGLESLVRESVGKLL